MKIYRASFMDQFECAKGDCPLTCCHGWQIPVDPESYANYRRTFGKLGIKLRLSLGGSRDLPVLNPNAGTCPFQNHDKLCGLQLEKGEEFIPGICRRFPKRLKNYGYFCEEALELACPVAAELFLASRHEEKGYKYKQLEGQVSYPDTTGNDDQEFLNQLVEYRFRIIHFMREGKNDTLTDLFTRLTQLQKYGKIVQMHCAKTGSEQASPDLSDFYPENYSLTVEEAPEIMKFLFSIETTDSVMCSGVYHSNLKSRLPLFYELCRLYFDHFDSLTAHEGSDHLHELYMNFEKKHPEIVGILNDYYIYYMQTNLLFVYEDYSFLRYHTLGALHIHLLLLFFCLYDEKYASFTEKECALIIAVYERHMRHNDALTDSLWEIIPKFV